MNQYRSTYRRSGSAGSWRRNLTRVSSPGGSTIRRVARRGAGMGGSYGRAAASRFFKRGGRRSSYGRGMDTNAVKKTYGIGELLGMALERAVPVFRGIPDAALGAATPCAEYDVKALVNHVFQVIVQFQRLAVKEPSDFGEVTPDRVAEGPDWRERAPAGGGQAGGGRGAP